MTYFDESLTNDQKIRLMDMATRMASAVDYEDMYKKMVALVTTHNPDLESIAAKLSDAVKAGEIHLTASELA